jgi:hypothetical protein
MKFLNLVLSMWFILFQNANATNIPHTLANSESQTSLTFNVLKILAHIFPDLDGSNCADDAKLLIDSLRSLRKSENVPEEKISKLREYLLTQDPELSLSVSTAPCRTFLAFWEWIDNELGRYSLNKKSLLLSKCVDSYCFRCRQNSQHWSEKLISSVDHFSNIGEEFRKTLRVGLCPFNMCSQPSIAKHSLTEQLRITNTPRFLFVSSSLFDTGEAPVTPKIPLNGQEYEISACLFECASPLDGQYYLECLFEGASSIDGQYYLEFYPENFPPKFTKGSKPRLLVYSRKGDISKDYSHMELLKMIYGPLWQDIDDAPNNVREHDLIGFISIINLSLLNDKAITKDVIATTKVLVSIGDREVELFAGYAIEVYVQIARGRYIRRPHFTVVVDKDNIIQTGPLDPASKYKAIELKEWDKDMTRTPEEQKTLYYNIQGLAQQLIDLPDRKC